MFDGRGEAIFPYGVGGEGSPEGSKLYLDPFPGADHLRSSTADIVFTECDRFVDLTTRGF